MIRPLMLLSSILCVSWLCAAVACTKGPASTPATSSPVEQAIQSLPSQAVKVSTKVLWKKAEEEAKALSKNSAIIRVTYDAILIDGKRVVTLKNGLVDPPIPINGLITPIVDALKENVPKGKHVTVNLHTGDRVRKKSLDGFLFLDGDIPVHVLLGVMNSMRDAGVNIRQTVVSRPDGSLDVFKLSPEILAIGLSFDKEQNKSSVSVQLGSNGVELIYRNPQEVSQINVPLNVGNTFAASLTAYKQATTSSTRRKAILELNKAYSQQVLYKGMLTAKTKYPNVEVIDFRVPHDYPVDLLAMLSKISRMKRKGTFETEAAFQAAASPQSFNDLCSSVSDQCLFPYARLIYAL